MVLNKKNLNEYYINKNFTRKMCAVHFKCEVGLIDGRIRKYELEKSRFKHFKVWNVPKMTIKTKNKIRENQPTRKEVEVLKDGKVLYTCKSIILAAKKTGVDRCLIRQILSPKYKRYSSGGFKFRLKIDTEVKEFNLMPSGSMATNGNMSINDLARIASA